MSHNRKLLLEHACTVTGTHFFAKTKSLFFQTLFLNVLGILNQSYKEKVFVFICQIITYKPTYDVTLFSNLLRKIGF